jgi:phage gp45-like
MIVVDTTCDGTIENGRMTPLLKEHGLSDRRLAGSGEVVCVGIGGSTTLSVAVISRTGARVEPPLCAVHHGGGRI